MKIYTRTGDKGETSLFTGDRVPKDDAFMHALGTIDECCSSIGLALATMPQGNELAKERRQLVVIQHALFDLGAAVATPLSRASESKVQKTRFDEGAVRLLEEWMDEMSEVLPPLKTFILPGGHLSAAHLHMARNICRRAERHCIPLLNHAAINQSVLIYLNRLSDYLFMLARLLNKSTGTAEALWEQHLSTSHEL